MDGPVSKLTLDCFFCLKNSNFFFFFCILVYFDVDSVIVPSGVVATLEFNFGPFQGSIINIVHNNII